MHRFESVLFASDFGSAKVYYFLLLKMLQVSYSGNIGYKVNNAKDNDGEV